MVKNSLIYPDDFVSTNKSSVDGVFTTIEGAYTALAIQARDTAIRQVNARRTAQGSAISAQNRSIKNSATLIPFYRVGKTIASQPFLGTAAYTGGKNGHNSLEGSSFFEFPFANEVIVPITSRLVTPALYRGCVGNTESGKMAGGWIAPGYGNTKTIDKLVYLKRIISQVSATLSQPCSGTTGGMGNKDYGLLINSVTVADIVNNCHRYNHATDTLSVYSNFLTSPRYSPHGGLSSQTSGYMWAGITRWLSGNLVAVIDEIPYTTLETTPVATQLSNFGDIGEINPYHAAMSSPTKGYILGGSLCRSQKSCSNVIRTFNYTTKMASTLSAQLSDSMICVSGAGHSNAGFTFGGNTSDTVAKNWMGIKKIQKLDYSNESIFILGTQLSVEMADQPAISDYLPSFY